MPHPLSTTRFNAVFCLRVLFQVSAKINFTFLGRACFLHVYKSWCLVDTQTIFELGPSGVTSGLPTTRPELCLFRFPQPYFAVRVPLLRLATIRPPTGIGFATWKDVLVQSCRLCDDLMSQPVAKTATLAYCNLAYSTLARLRMGMSGSASFQSTRKSWYFVRALAVSPESA